MLTIRLGNVWSVPLRLPISKRYADGFARGCKAFACFVVVLLVAFRVVDRTR